MTKEGIMLKIGDWVHAVDSKNKITGFIISKHDNQVEIAVTIPANYSVITRDISELVEGESTIWFDDIPELINLALKISDVVWLRKWVNELAKWKGINEVNF